jgi:O-antigen/teichoic acid export membrane protein
MIKKYINLFFSGNARSVNAKKHIIASLVYKGIQICLGFITIRVNLSYLSTEAYGLWTVISSFIGWFDLFDFGLGNGLKNKFAECKAKNKISEAREYVSTTYFLLSLISLGLLIAFLITNVFIDWDQVFGASYKFQDDVNRLIIFVFISFLFRFILKLITTILTADQKSSYRELFDTISKFISLIIILILLNTKEESLLLFGIVYCSVPLIVLLAASIFYFNGEYKAYRPSLQYLNLKQSKGILNLGTKFFIIQLTVLIMFSTDNMIITQIFSPKDVTTYSFAGKLFQVIWLLSTLILNAFWSAFTEAYLKKDFTWIKGIMKKLKKLWFLLLVVDILAVLISPIAYDYFDKRNEVVVPISLTLATAFWNIFAAYGHIYMYFLNGTGKVKLQLICAVIGAIINIPLSIFFAKTLGFGLAGIILATTVSYSYTVIIGPIQYRLIIKDKAYGIFNK